MNLPPAAMIRHFGHDLDQPLDDPLHGSSDLLALEVERPEHVKEIVDNNARKQPGLVGFELLTTCPVPAISISSTYLSLYNSFILRLWASLSLCSQIISLS